MSFEHLYKPQPMDAWDRDRLAVVGEAYRRAAGEGADPATCVARAQQAYFAGGGRSTDLGVIHAMVATLAAHQGDWLFGPAQARIDREHPPPRDEPPPEWLR